MKPLVPPAFEYLAADCQAPDMSELKFLSSQAAEQVLSSKEPAKRGAAADGAASSSPAAPLQRGRRKIKLSEKARSLALESEIKAGNIVTINGLMIKKEDLIVPDFIKQRVQTRLEHARQQRTVLMKDGLCKHARRQIPAFLARKVSVATSATSGGATSGSEQEESVAGTPKKRLEVFHRRTPCKSPVSPAGAVGALSRGVQLVEILDSDSDLDVDDAGGDDDDDDCFVRVDDEISLRSGSSRSNTPDPFAFTSALLVMWLAFTSVLPGKWLAFLLRPLAWLLASNPAYLPATGMVSVLLISD